MAAIFFHPETLTLTDWYKNILYTSKLSRMLGQGENVKWGRTQMWPILAATCPIIVTFWWASLKSQALFPTILLKESFPYVLIIHFKFLGMNLFFFFYLVVSGIKPRASCTLSTYSITKLHFKPWICKFWDKNKLTEMLQVQHKHFFLETSEIKLLTLNHPKILECVIYTEGLNAICLPKYPCIEGWVPKVKILRGFVCLEDGSKGG